MQGVRIMRMLHDMTEGTDELVDPIDTEMGGGSLSNDADIDTSD